MKQFLTTVLLSISCLFNAQNLQNGLQACYLLDGNANNSAASGPLLNGTLNNVSPATGHTGLANTAFSLSGNTSSYIELPDMPGLKNNRLFFTGWFNFTSLTANQYLVYTKNSCLNYFEAYALNAYFSPISSQFEFVVTKSSSGCLYAPQVESTVGITPSTWYHVGFFVTDTVIKLYVNGVFQASAIHAIMFDYVSGKSVFIGVTNEPNYNLTSNMVVDNMRFYNRELSAGEVLSLYNQDAPCTAPPVPTATFTSSKKQICTGQVVTFTNQSTNSPTAVTWTFPGGAPPTSTLNNPVVTYPVAGTYSVALVATNASGSSNVAITTVTVGECLSLSEYTPEDFSIFPNPSAAKIIIKNVENCEIRITDLRGTMIRYHTEVLSEGTVELDLSDKAEGMYFLHIIAPSGVVLESAKVILKR